MRAHPCSLGRAPRRALHTRCGGPLSARGLGRARNEHPSAPGQRQADGEVVFNSLLLIDFCVVRSTSATLPWREAANQSGLVPIYFLQARGSVTSSLLAMTLGRSPCPGLGCTHNCVPWR